MTLSKSTHFNSLLRRGNQNKSGGNKFGLYGGCSKFSVHLAGQAEGDDNGGVRLRNVMMEFPQISDLRNAILALQEHPVPPVRLGSKKAIFPESSMKIFQGRFLSLTRNLITTEVHKIKLI